MKITESDSGLSWVNKVGNAHLNLSKKKIQLQRTKASFYILSSLGLDRLLRLLRGL